MNNGKVCYIEIPAVDVERSASFYASVFVRVLLVFARVRWSSVLYRLGGGELVSVGKINVSAGDPLASEVLPLSFRLVAGSPRPIIVVRVCYRVLSW